MGAQERKEGAVRRAGVRQKQASWHQTFCVLGYLTQNVELIMQAVGVAEDNIFRKRKEDDESFERRMKEKKKRMKMDQRKHHQRSCLHQEQSHVQPQDTSPGPMSQSPAATADHSS
ncbi:hypothetical protein WMY93_015836 [Mugilogobius chulae]|uniref:Xrn1 helical domain-containing protein n=1 Tax=Mugilogobius chulae TaxID=88201 RepID=A0AAW0NVV4_9GOBI